MQDWQTAKVRAWAHLKIRIMCPHTHVIQYVYIGLCTHTCEVASGGNWHNKHLLVPQAGSLGKSIILLSFCRAVHMLHTHIWGLHFIVQVPVCSRVSQISLRSHSALIRFIWSHKKSSRQNWTCSTASIFTSAASQIGMSSEKEKLSTLEITIDIASTKKGHENNRIHLWV